MTRIQSRRHAETFLRWSNIEAWTITFAFPNTPIALHSYGLHTGVVRDDVTHTLPLVLLAVPGEQLGTGNHLRGSEEVGWGSRGVQTTRSQLLRLVRYLHGMQRTYSAPTARPTTYLQHTYSTGYNTLAARPTTHYSTPRARLTTHLQVQHTYSTDYNTLTARPTTHLQHTYCTPTSTTHLRHTHNTPTARPTTYLRHTHSTPTAHLQHTYSTAYNTRTRPHRMVTVRTVYSACMYGLKIKHNPQMTVRYSMTMIDYDCQIFNKCLHPYL